LSDCALSLSALKKEAKMAQMTIGLRMEMRLEEERAEERADPPADYAQCARCGQFNRLVKRRAVNGGVIWLQPTHRCADGIITEA
jgi:hypothetical protein